MNRINPDRSQWDEPRHHRSSHRLPQSFFGHLSRPTSTNRPRTRSDSFSPICSDSTFRKYFTIRVATVLRHDNHILRHINETARQITGIGSTQSCIRQTLYGYRDDEIKNSRTSKPSLKVSLDRQFDNFSRWRGDQTLHANNLAELPHEPRAPESIMANTEPSLFKPFCFVRAFTLFDFSPNFQNFGMSLGIGQKPLDCTVPRQVATDLSPSARISLFL